LLTWLIGGGVWPSYQFVERITAFMGNSKIIGSIRRAK
jgi:hypothetical protein